MDFVNIFSWVPSNSTPNLVELDHIFQMEEAKLDILKWLYNIEIKLAYSYVALIRVRLTKAKEVHIDSWQGYLLQVWSYYFNSKINHWFLENVEPDTW